MKKKNVVTTSRLLVYVKLMLEDRLNNNQQSNQFWRFPTEFNASSMHSHIKSRSTNDGNNEGETIYSRMHVRFDGWGRKWFKNVEIIAKLAMNLIIFFLVFFCSNDLDTHQNEERKNSPNIFFVQIPYFRWHFDLKKFKFAHQLLKSVLLTILLCKNTAKVKNRPMITMRSMIGTCTHSISYDRVYKMFKIY